MMGHAVGVTGGEGGRAGVLASACSSGESHRLQIRLKVQAFALSPPTTARLHLAAYYGPPTESHNWPPTTARLPLAVWPHTGRPQLPPYCPLSTGRGLLAAYSCPPTAGRLLSTRGARGCHLRPMRAECQRPHTTRTASTRRNAIAPESVTTLETSRHEPPTAGDLPDGSRCAEADRFV